MQIKNLNITQYKSLKNLKLDNLFDINIFIGPNNSGKSNILDAIESVFLPFDNSVSFTDRGSDYTISIELDSEAKRFFKTTASNLKITRQCDQKKYFLGSKEVINLKLIESFFRQRAVRFNSYLINNIEKIRSDYADLKKNYSTAFKKLWRVFNKIFPDIDEIVSTEISAQTTRQIKAKLKSGKVVEFIRLGSGVRRVFIMMLYIFHPRYGIILMNEPETKLHPALIKKVSDLLQTNVKNEQVFLTTHSPIFITPHNLQQVFRTNKNKKQETEVYYCTCKDNINRNRLVQEFNVDNLEMFFADKVVIVEGVSDKILIRGLIDKFYQGNDEIKVISVAGKNNVDIYIRLMQIFKIPYLILLDLDALAGGGVKAIQPYITLQNFKIGRYKRRRKKGRPAHRTGRHRRNRQRQRLPSSLLRQLEELKKRHIYILPNGAIENNYPRKYQRRDTKPLNALYAVSQITAEDFYSHGMRYLREVIEVL